MTTLEIGQQLVAYLRAGKNQEAMEALYAPDIVSVEAGAPPGGDPVVRGVAGCIAKSQAFRARMEIHAMTVEGPFPHGDRFAVYLAYEGTPRGGTRTTMKEVALYTVANDRIAREEFFYSM